MDYHDAAQPAVRQQFATLIAEAEKHDWPYPLVMMNDKPVMAGYLDAYQLSVMVQQMLGTDSTNGPG